MDCLCRKAREARSSRRGAREALAERPKKEKKESKTDWLTERRNIRMYNARLNAIIEELEDSYHYEQYKKRFKLLFEFYQLEELLK